MDKERQYSFIMTEENKSKVEQFLKLLNIDTDIIEAENIKEQQKEWPKDGDEFYYISATGNIPGDYYYAGGNISNNILSIGNCFKTKEEAKFEVERLKVLAEMKKFAEPYDRDWDGYNDHYMICIDMNNKDIFYSCNNTNKTGGIYFESKEKAMECVNAIGADRIKKYFLRVED